MCLEHFEIKINIITLHINRRVTFKRIMNYTEMKDSNTKYYREIPSMPKRYVVALLGFFGTACKYSMQVTLSVTVLAMSTRPQNLTKNGVAAVVECPMLIEKENKSSTLHFKGVRFDWDSEDRGLILASFFYGYLLTQIPGGYLAQFYSPKWIFGIGLFLSGLLCFLTPAAAERKINKLVAVRIMQGLCQGVTKPALNAILSKWAPKFERSRMSTFMLTGGLVGSIVTMPLSGIISSCDALGGWPSVFIFFGIITSVWFVLWTWLVFDSPQEHPYVTNTELSYFNGDIQTHNIKKGDIPWKEIFTSKPVWAVIIAHFGDSFGFFTIFTELPNYMENVLHFNLRKNGFLSALPFVVATLTAWTTSYAADKLRETGKLNITNIRKIFNSFGLFGPAFFLMTVTISGCKANLIVGLICTALAFNGFTYSGFSVTQIDMSPNFASVLFGISNTFSTLSGILAPAIVGVLTSYGETILEWNRVFYIVVLFYVFCGLFYNIFSSAELQEWDTVNEIER